MKCPLCRAFEGNKKQVSAHVCGTHDRQHEPYVGLKDDGSPLARAEHRSDGTFVGLWDPEDEPDGDSLAPHHLWVGLAITAFGFGSVWRYYPTVGATMTAIGMLVAADDAIEHITGYNTPLNWLWERYIYPRLPSTD